MKRAVLSALFLGLVGALAVVPASADSTIYNSGTSTYNFDTWNINSPFTVSDSFSLLSNEIVTGGSFVVWLDSTDALSSVDWSIGTSPYDTSIASGTASSLTPTSLGPNGLTDPTEDNAVINVYSESFSGLGVTLAGGTTYYLTLSNAVATNKDPVYWDENDGSSTGYSSSLAPAPGSIGAYDCSNDFGCGLSGGETFTLQGTTTPEPSSFLLLGSGLAGLAGLLRRKIRA
jgi:hypothetical protein